MRGINEKVCSCTKWQAILGKLRIICLDRNIRQKIIFKGTPFVQFKRFNQSPNKVKLAGEITIHIKQMATIIHFVHSILCRIVQSVVSGTGWLHLAYLACKASNTGTGKLDSDVITVFIASSSIQTRICLATAIYTASDGFLARESDRGRNQDNNLICQFLHVHFVSPLMKYFRVFGSGFLAFDWF